MIDSEVEETDDTASDHPAEPRESDDTAADDASQATGESARVEVLSAEVRVLQVGNGQITRSTYRQLDEPTPEQFQPFGRVKDNKPIPKEWGRPKEGVLQLVGRDTKTGALVRYDAKPPDWSASDGPGEFEHWLRHQPGVRERVPYNHRYPVANMTGSPFSGPTVLEVMSAMVRDFGTSRIKLRRGCANWTGRVRLKCDSSAARSTSTT